MSYLGTSPLQLQQQQNAAQEGTSSVPGGGVPKQTTTPQGPQTGATDYSGGNSYLTGLNYGPSGGGYSSAANSSQYPTYGGGLGSYLNYLANGMGTYGSAGSMGAQQPSGGSLLNSLFGGPQISGPTPYGGGWTPGGQPTYGGGAGTAQPSGAFNPTPISQNVSAGFGQLWTPQSIAAANAAAPPAGQNPFQGHVWPTTAQGLLADPLFQAYGNNPNFFALAQQAGNQPPTIGSGGYYINPIPGGLPNYGVGPYPGTPSGGAGAAGTSTAGGGGSSQIPGVIPVPPEYSSAGPGAQFQSNGQFYTIQSNGTATPLNQGGSNAPREIQPPGSPGGPSLPPGASGQPGQPIYSPGAPIVPIPPGTGPVDPVTGQPIGGGGGGSFPGGTGGGGTNFPSYGGPPYQPNAAGQFPNTYGGPFTSTAPGFNSTVPSTMFSGNEGPQQGAVGRPPTGYGVVPPYSPAMSQTYFQWLMNQAGNLGQGVGATPYGQQNTFLPSQGQTGLAGLSAPMGPFSQYAQNALTSNIGNIGNLLDPNNLQGMMGQYQPLTQQAGLQSQYGARGNPNDPYGLYTGAQALQGSASGTGLPGLPGQYVNSAMQFGGMGLPAQTQAAFAQYGAGPGAGGTTLSNMAQFGNPINQTPAWQAMVQAQQRNIGENQAQVARQAAVGGNLLGTPYQTALADFQNQAALNQNALLGQMTAGAQENAAQRMLGAAGTMSGQQLGAAQNLGALQQQAGLFGAGQQTANSQYLQNLMAQGLGQQGQFTAMGQQIPNQIYQNYLGQMGGQIGNALNLGQQYQGLDQNAINRQYQEFLRTQPEYSPLLQQLFAGATTFPGVVNTQFGAGTLPTAIGQAAGSALGGGGAFSGSTKPWWIP